MAIMELDKSTILFIYWSVILTLPLDFSTALITGKEIKSPVFDSAITLISTNADAKSWDTLLPNSSCLACSPLSLHNSSSSSLSWFGWNFFL